jgi:hypothetical protein
MQGLWDNYIDPRHMVADCGIEELLFVFVLFEGYPCLLFIVWDKKMSKMETQKGKKLVNSTTKTDHKENLVG